MQQRLLLILGLGSNLGSRKENLDRTIAYLKEKIGEIDCISNYYETLPWGFTSENLFLNCCLGIYSDKQAVEILSITQKIEKMMGRISKSNNGVYASRIIDIDLLYYGSSIIKTKELIVPHPLIYGRKFVLEPLSSIYPNFIDPSKKESIQGLFKSYINGINE